MRILTNLFLLAIIIKQLKPLLVGEIVLVLSVALFAAFVATGNWLPAIVSGLVAAYFGLRKAIRDLFESG